MAHILLPSSAPENRSRVFPTSGIAAADRPSQAIPGRRFLRISNPRALVPLERTIRCASEMTDYRVQLQVMRGSRFGGAGRHSRYETRTRWTRGYGDDQGT